MKKFTFKKISLIALILTIVGAGIFWCSVNVMKPNRVSLDGKSTKYIIDHLKAFHLCGGHIDKDKTILDNVSINTSFVQNFAPECNDSFNDALTKKQKKISRNTVNYFPSVRMFSENLNSGMLILSVKGSKYNDVRCYEKMSKMFGRFANNYCEQIVSGSIKEIEKDGQAPLSREDVLKYRNELAEGNPSPAKWGFAVFYKLNIDTGYIELTNEFSSPQSQKILEEFSKGWGTYWHWINVVFNHESNSFVEQDDFKRPIFGFVEETEKGELRLRLFNGRSWILLYNIHSVIEQHIVQSVFHW